MKLPCKTCMSASLKRPQSDVLDENKKAVDSVSSLPTRFSGDACGAKTLEHRGHQRWHDGLAVQSRDRRWKERSNLGFVPSPPSAETDSEALLPRPYLMASRTAWVILDFICALCCGFVAILMAEEHLALHFSPPLMNSGQILTHLSSVIEVVVFASCVAALSSVFQLQPIEYCRTASSELVLIALSVSLAAYGVNGAMSSLVSTTSATKLLEFLLTGSALVLSRALWRRHWDANYLRDIAGRNVLIVGANSIGQDIKDHLSSVRYMGFRFKGFVALNEDSDDAAPSGDGAIVGGIDNVIPLAKSMFVDEIIFSHRPATTNILSDVLAQARISGIDVRLIPSLSETLRNRTDIEYLGNLPTIVLHRREKHAGSNLVKRAIDIVLGCVGIIVLSPLFLIIAVLIRLQSSGPVLYKSKRVGYKGTTFDCYKFRSMIENADSVRDQLAHLNERRDILFKIAKDPRVTSVGAFLRKYSLDELPQLWNVLNGDMSLVGPRPSIRSEVAQYQTAHLRRLDVIPGMTGLWQVEARQDPSFESYVNLDSKYVRDWSIWLDFKILARTLGAVLKGTGT
jgi:exopolysaccharide biosynthesis polyprenyl glycosylphosphotransferase